MCTANMNMVLIIIFFLGSSFAVPESEFYPFGLSNGDSVMDKNDDGSSPEIQVSTLFPFFNHQHRSLFVNNNGIISFQASVSSFTPIPFQQLTSGRWVVPFWADVDTTNGGSVFYRETTDPRILFRVTEEIKSKGMASGLPNFRAMWVFIATWKDVAFYGASVLGKTKRNTFQAILATNGRHSFTIFNYARIEWTTGKASGGDSNTGLGGMPAQVGFTYSDGGIHYAINASMTSKIINLPSMTNCRTKGKFMFRIETAEIQSHGCNSEGFLTVVPRFGNMLGGDEVRLSGPCFVRNVGKSSKQVVATVNFQKYGQKIPVDCRYHDDYTATCITPAMFVSGHVDLVLERKDAKKGSGGFRGHFSYVNIARLPSRLIREKPEEWTFRYKAKHSGGLRLSWKATHARNVLKCHGHKARLDLFALKETHEHANLVHLAQLSDEAGFDLNAGELVVKQLLPEFPLLTAGVIRMACLDEYVVMNTMSLWSDVHSIIWAGPATIHNVSRVCDSWIDTEKERYEYSKSLGHCPCNVAQAILDIGRFRPDPLCNRESSDRPFNCLQQSTSVHCIRSNAPPEGELGGQHCCYDRNGDLVEKDVNTATGKRFAGRTSRYNYLGKEPYDGIGKYPFVSNYLQDEIPYQYCCEFAMHNHGKDHRCRKYLELRPALTDCTRYVPPVLARLAGDPHMVTLDGAKYTFNGLGEYTVVETLDNSFTMQGRTEQATDGNGNLRQASVFTAVVIKGNNTDIVQIQKNEITVSEIAINGEWRDFDEQPWQDFEGLSIISTGGKTILVTFNDLAVGIQLEVTKHMINIVVTGPTTLKNNTRGLLGTWNGDVSDDFLFPNGSVLPQTATSREIHSFGESWKVDQNTSLFTYGRNRYYYSYNSHHNFQPAFIDELSASSITDEQAHICGNSTECLYDLRTSNNKAIANATRQAEEHFVEMVKTVEEVVVRCPYVSYFANGEALVSGHKPGDVATFTCNNNYHLVGNENITCNASGAWSGQEPICEAVQCPPVTKISNGGVLIFGRNPGAVITFICNQGYHLVGNQNITCNATGSWNGLEPMCKDDAIQKKSNPKGLSTLAVALIAAGSALVCVALIVSLSICIWRRKTTGRENLKQRSVQECPPKPTYENPSYQI